MTLLLEKRLNLIEKACGHSRRSKDDLNIAIECPFCNKKNGKTKLVIRVDNPVYHCWVCGTKGKDVIYLFKRFFKRYLEEAKVLFKNKRISVEESAAEEIEIHLPEDFELIPSIGKALNPDKNAVKKYSLNRGASLHKQWMLKLGASNKDNFNRSLIIPSFDINGKLNFYTCRKIDAMTNNGRKYVNAEVSKSEIIFNEYLIDWSRPLTLVEGPLDLLKTNDNATCLLGSHLGENFKLFQQIVKHKTDVYLALDYDAYWKAQNIARLLASYDINVWIVKASKEKDVGDMSEEEFLKRLDQAEEWFEDDYLLKKIRSL